MAARSRKAKSQAKITRIKNEQEAISSGSNRIFYFKLFLLLAFLVFSGAYIKIRTGYSLTTLFLSSSTHKQVIPSPPLSSKTTANRIKKPRVKAEKKSSNSKKSKNSASFHPSIHVKNITLDGRTVVIKELKHNYEKSSVRIYQIDNFLTKHECDGLSSVHVRHVQQLNSIGPLFCFSGVDTFRKYLQEAHMNFEISEKDFVFGTSCVNETFSNKLREKFKWSYSTAFYSGESPFSLIYEERLQNLSGLLKSHGGKYQLTSYPKSIGYKSHTDCTIGSFEYRDRYATALVYLQDVRRGGETIFSKLGITVQPRQGRLIIWNNMDRDGKCDPSSVHEAAPVLEGRKYILQRWYYYKNFPSLGRRPTEPEIPKRKPSQPRVSCDKFEEGSCRWYDEWGFDHLDAYKSVESSLQ